MDAIILEPAPGVDRGGHEAADESVGVVVAEPGILPEVVGHHGALTDPLAQFDQHTPEDSEDEASTSNVDKRTWEDSLLKLVGRIAAPASFVLNGATVFSFSPRRPHKFENVPHRAHPTHQASILTAYTNHPMRLTHRHADWRLRAHRPQHRRVRRRHRVKRPQRRRHSIGGPGRHRRRRGFRAHPRHRPTCSPRAVHRGRAGHPRAPPVPRGRREQPRGREGGAGPDGASSPSRVQAGQRVHLIRGAVHRARAAWRERGAGAQPAAGRDGGVTEQHAHRRHRPVNRGFREGKRHERLVLRRRRHAGRRWHARVRWIS